jgi:hypothetical protein
MSEEYLNEKKEQEKLTNKDEAVDFSNKISKLNHFFISDFLNYLH